MNELDRHSNKFTKWYLLADFLLVGLSFFIANYFQRGSFTLSKTYWNLLVAYYIFWAFIVYMEKKYTRLQQVDFLGAWALAGKTCLYLLFLISFLTVLMQLSGFSRKQVLVSCVILFSTEGILYSLYSHQIGGNSQSSQSSGSPNHLSFKISWLRLLLDVFLLFFSYFIINVIRRGQYVFSEDYLLIAYIITGLWFITSILTQKFKRANLQNIWYYISPSIKSLILMLFGLTLSIFLLKSYYLSRFELFGTMMVFGGSEILIFSAFYLLFKDPDREDDIESIDDVRKMNKQKMLDLTEKSITTENYINPALIYLFIDEERELYDFINSEIDIASISSDSMVFLDTRTSFNITQYKNDSIGLFVNLHTLNDFRWLNRYLLTLYEKISDGGYIVGNLQTNDQYKERFFSKMPPYLARILFIPSFIFRRAFPKLPILKQFYFFLTDGKNRALSKAEAFGRLYFCGYEVIAEKEIDKHLWFIARKVKTVSIDQNPSYSPLIKLPRIGLNGNVINIYKFRTMYPYSEYLQEYAYQHNSLDEKGKIKDDFRMTGWGKVFRKLWIDELPQIINWFRGEVSLVGVRALSQHFFDLYPEDMQKLRVQFKPGLVPPYYADMPKSFDEIVESEIRYLLQKMEKPFITDINYFYKAFYNIIFRHARSR